MPSMSSTGEATSGAARVDEIGKAHARVQLEASIAPAVEPQVSRDPSGSLLKGDKMDDVVRDAVMLGVAES